MSMTIKFAYIQWQGKSVPFIKRGKFGVVHGSIEKLFDVSRLYNFGATAVSSLRLIDCTGVIC